MRIDPLQIGYLQLSSGPHAHLVEGNILQIAETIAATATPFQLIPEFQRARLENI